jgi:uncharacterized lipoprotein YddW (UPF0748 family)
MSTLLRNVALLLGCLLCSVGSASEFRGIWVDAFGPGFHNKEQVRQLVQDCRKYNFNAVVVQMRKRGDAYYIPKAPNDEPRASTLAKDFDALAEIIKQCHNSELWIEVHCWLVAYFVWAWDKSPPEANHVFNQHHDWLTKDSIGQKMMANGYYLDPGHPEVYQHLLNVAKDVTSRYDIDGLHWDYLRYPSQDSGYNETALRRFKEEFGVKKNPHPADPQFSDWRRRQVSDFVRASSAELLELKPKLVVSASVFSNYKDSRDYRFADWVEWNKEGTIDITMPMDFSPDNEFVFKPRADFAFTNQWNRTVYVGQGAYMNTKENTLAQLNYCKTKGFNGTVFYSYRNPAILPASEGAERNANEIIVDNRKAEVVGAWQTGEFGKKYRKDYHYKTKGNGDAYVSFKPMLPETGLYAVYEWHVAGPNRAAKVPVVITHQDGTNRVTVNQQKSGAVWNLLGRFNFSRGTAEVRVSDKIQEPEKVIVADAVRFVKVEGDESDRDIVDPAAEHRFQNQRETFQFIKENFQQQWEETPTLPWKSSGCIVKGRIITNDGLPVYNQVVVIESDLTRQQRTDVHGGFAFHELPPGHYKISVGETEVVQVEAKIGAVVSKVVNVND